VSVDGIPVVVNGVPRTFDIEEIRAKAAEAAATLHSRL
jgi:hypothetical protein